MFKNKEYILSAKKEIKKVENLIVELPNHSTVKFNNMSEFKQFIEKYFHENGFKYHHQSITNGYCKQLDIKIEKYDGVFGDGFSITTNNENNPKYAIKKYFIKE